MAKVSIEQGLHTKGGKLFWIGFNNIDKDGYRWSDGLPRNFTNWSPYQPDYRNNIEHCGEIYSNGRWNDANCYNGRRGWICKLLKGVTPPTSPIVVNETFPGNKYLLRKIKFHQICILYLVSKCEDVGDSKLNWVQYRDKCYYASPSDELDYVSWQKAESFCKENGGFLVSIHDVDELTFILSRV